MIFKKQNLNILECVYASQDDLNELAKTFNNDFSGLVLNFSIKIKKDGKDVAIVFDEKDITMKDFEAFVKALKQNFYANDKDFEISEKIVKKYRIKKKTIAFDSSIEVIRGKKKISIKSKI